MRRALPIALLVIAALAVAASIAFVSAPRSLDSAFQQLFARELKVAFDTIEHRQTGSWTDPGGEWLIRSHGDLRSALTADARFGVADEHDTAYYRTMLRERAMPLADLASATLYRGDVSIPGTACEPAACAAYLVLPAASDVAYVELHKF